ncbi:MAG: hypothetical protein KDF24_05155 [Rhodocyclaceae bacterium]|nr:hypothetical protein [Rhodocyclaceae bacterium]
MKSSSRRTLRRRFALVALITHLSSGVQAGAIEDALNKFGTELQKFQQKEAQFDRPATKQTPLFKPPPSTPVQQGTASDFKRHQLRMGTEVRISRTNLERIRSAPRLAAAPVNACIGESRGGGSDAGRLVIDGYESSQESPASNPHPGEGPAKGPFTVFWARVHHVVIASNDPLGRDDTHACKGWTRIDSSYLYYQGTGDYAHSVLRSWNESAVPPMAKAQSPRVTITQNGHMVDSPRPGLSRPVCLAVKGDQYIVLERLPASHMLKVASTVRTRGGCAANTAVYMPERLIN